MIVRFRVVRKDNLQPIQGAKVTLETGESVGITNAQGEAEIRTEWWAVLKYSVEATGYGTVYDSFVFPAGDVQKIDVEMGAFVDPGTPTPGGENVIGSIGTSCDLLHKYMFGRAWYSYRNRYTGEHWSWDSELGDAEHSARGNIGCFAPPPPPPKTVDEVSKDVDILRGTIQGVSSRIQDLATGIMQGLAGISKRIDEMQKGLDAIWDKLEAWLVERIVRIVLAGLDREAEAKK